MQVRKAQMLYMCGEAYRHATVGAALRQASQPLVSDSCLAGMQVRKAQMLYMCGEAYRHAAALLVSEALHRDPEHEGALLEYVRIVRDRGHTADAVRILLRLLVNSRERTTVRQATSQAALCVLNGRGALLYYVSCKGRLGPGAHSRCSAHSAAAAGEQPREDHRQASDLPGCPLCLQDWRMALVENMQGRCWTGLALQRQRASR